MRDNENMSNMNASDSVKPGTVCAGHIVEKLLGKGGMGSVYLARSQASGELHALKVLRPPGGDDGREWRKRFSREAELAMKIRHDNLVEVYSFGDDFETGLCYMVMEYVPGGTLSSRISSEGRFGMREAIDVVVQIASALDVAHHAGVVHRDIKPANIMFDAKGRPKLADLGVAKFKSDGVSATTLTAAGVMIGTPAYMSPEQMMDAHSVDRRADIYSLGLVLYEMLTGKRPHAESTIVELLALAVKGEEIPDIRSVRPEVSAAVAYVISLMVSINPEDRPPSARNAARLLENAYSGKVKVPEEFVRYRAAAKTRRNRRRIVTVILSAVVLSLAALFVTWTAARKGMQAIPYGVDSITTADIEILASTIVKSLASPDAMNRLRSKEPNVRAVIRVMPVEVQRQSGEQNAKAVATEIEMLLRKNLTDAGQFIVYDADAAASSGAAVRIPPKYILKSSLSCLVEDDTKRSVRSEYRLNVTIVDVSSGLQVLHKSANVAKMIGR